MSEKKLIMFILILLLILPLLSTDTRGYLLTGNWYPMYSSDLSAMLERFLKRATPAEVTGRIHGLVVPHAGLAFSGKCAANAFALLKQQKNISRVILLGVAHRADFYGACISSFSYNTTPLGKIALDRTVLNSLAREKDFKVDNKIMKFEHSLENQLPFLQMVFRKGAIKLVPILFSRLNRDDYKRMARIISKYINRHTLVIASTDLTHYGSRFGYLPFRTNIKDNLTRLDKGIIKPLIDLDFKSYYEYKKKTGITMCGFTPVGVLIQLMKSDHVTGRLVSYYKSGDSTGDYSLSVSYASLVFFTGHGGGALAGTNQAASLTINEKKTLLTIARDALDGYFKKGKMPANMEKKFDLTDRLRQKNGVFVTLKKKGVLRGCIGSIIGRESLYKGIIRNVLKAALKDPRFKPVQKREVKDLHIEISVMTPLQEIFNYQKIRLGIDGVIIKRNHYQAVFLPQVAITTGWNLDQFLARLSQKAGLKTNGYKSPGTRFFIFQAQVFNDSEVAGED